MDTVALRALFNSLGVGTMDEFVGRVQAMAGAAEIERFLNETEEGRKLVAQAADFKEKTKREVKAIADFIKTALNDKTKRGKAKFIKLPEYVNMLAERKLGHKIKSHRIGANEINHAYNHHGVGGSKLNENSIPLRKEDFELLPYIMYAPDRVEKSEPQVNGSESIKYIKELSDGTVVVVEREGRNDVEEMENINMWADKKNSLSPYDVYAPKNRASHATSATLVISPKDAAKIRQDFEIAIEKEAKRKINLQIDKNQFKSTYLTPNLPSRRDRLSRQGGTSSPKDRGSVEGDAAVSDN
jgi:hypothetical protein